MEYGAVVAWWLVLVAIGFAGLPIAATLLARIPGEGAAFALPVGLVVLAIPVYWLGHLAYGPITLAAGVVALVTVSAGLARRDPDVDLGRFAGGLAVFTVGFLLLVAVRGVDPSIHTAGGEKFLDFGLLKAMGRAGRLPPEDMWFAGEPVNYYYGGHMISAILAALSGVPARLAYNLALAGFYGALVTTAYGLAGSIAAAAGRSYRLAGVLGALLVGLGSNLVAPLQALLWALPSAVAEPLAGAVAARTATEATQLLAWGTGSPVPFYWTSSRVIRGTINEFPLFAFLNGDLHAHMMSTPFLLLVAAIAFAYYRTPAGAVWERRALVFGAVPAVAGLVAVVNTWSFPSTVGVTWLAVLFGPPPEDLLPRGLADRLPAGDGEGGGANEELSRVGAATASAVGVLLLGVVWVVPFFVGPATGAGGRSLGPVGDRSGLVEFVLVHGWILAVFAAYLAPLAADRVARRAEAAVLVGLIAVLGLLADVAGVALVLPLLAVAWLLLRRGEAGFEAVLFVAGAGLVVLVELVFVSEQAGPGRMNTVFKTYMQVWVLWAAGAAAALVRLLPRGLPDTRRGRAGPLLAAVLVVSVSVYGAVALGGHFSGARDPTLDATTWARTNHPDEWEAIRFLDGRPGRPAIVTAPGCWCNPEGLQPYSWVNAPSSFTGVPTLAGWSHEVGYRGRAAYTRRVEDVRRIYTGTPGERRALLSVYDVRYVYVGPNERELYGEELAEFEGHDWSSVAFRNRAVTIYEVDRGEL